jgi:serine protease inhibitor
MSVVYKVEQNKKFKDFRVVKYFNGEWINERDGNWTKNKAEQKAKEYRELTKKGIKTMGDEV